MRLVKVYCVIEWSEPVVLHWHAPPELHVQLCVSERCCGASIFLSRLVLPWLPFSQATGLQSLHRNPLILNYPGTVPSRQGRAMSQARFMTPFVLQSGRTLLTWWMEWQDRCLHNYPRGIKYSCLAACKRRGWSLEGNQRTKLGAQMLPDWMAGCTGCIWPKAESV